MLVDDLGPSAPDKLGVKLSNDLIWPWSLIPLARKMVTSPRLSRRCFRNRSWRVEGLCATISCSCCKLACLGSKLPLDDVLPIKIRLDDPAVLLA
jgi:hypothetical protein